MNLFQSALKRENIHRPPVWFMRQAGRYHSHYQSIRKKHSFIDVCKRPEIACEATMGPIQDFDFDAAILFSDLLFPLECMGMDLEYAPGPKLGHRLQTVEQVQALRSGKELAKKLEFQSQAIEMIRKQLPQEKGLLGFVGAPLTLFFYAVEGSHKGELLDAKKGLADGRYEAFQKKLIALLTENILLQWRAGVDCVSIMDTCAGEIDSDLYREVNVPALSQLLSAVKAQAPDIVISYYSKKTTPKHWETLVDLPIQGIGVDWNHDLSEVLTEWNDRFCIQGNIDPHWMLLPKTELEPKLRGVFEKVARLSSHSRRGWICGLGHGILPPTPEENVTLFIQLQREIFH